MTNAKTARADSGGSLASIATDATQSSSPVGLADLLDALGYRADEFVAVCHQPPGGDFRASVMSTEAAPSYAVSLGDGVNVWFSVNPTTARDDGRRGTAEQTTRLAALYVDLDVKPGACSDLAAAEKIIDELSMVLGQRPSVVVLTGHGLQPYWPIDDGDVTTTFSTTDAAALLRRFGRLVAVVAEHQHAAADNVFDLPRVLRVPPSVNVKSDPVPVTARRDVGGPLTVAEVDERLTEVGIGHQPDDTSAAVLVSDPTGWQFAAQTCPYVAKLLDGLKTDGPRNGGGRNPWACSQAVRLCCAWRRGCITSEDFQRGIALLEARLATLLASTEPRRALRRLEMRDAFRLGEQRAACKTDEQARDELGRHGHAPTLSDPWGTGAVGGSALPPADALLPADPLSAGDDLADPLDGAIEHAMTLMRIRREATRRLDAEERPPLQLPAIKSLDALLAEPDSPARYRIEGLMPENSRIVLSAQKKTGKTTMVGNLARSLVDAEPFLGAFAVNQPVRGLVWIDDELGDDMMRRWLRDQRIRNTAAVVDTVSLRGKVAAFDLLDDRRRSEWARRLSDVGCDFLVLDCLRPVLDALGLDENRDAGKFLVPFDALLDEAGVSNAALVHHMGHSGERSRGDSRIEDWPDAIWRLVRESDDPHSNRYLSAFGRDVDVREGRLTFDPATRHLGYVGESRGDAKTEAAYVAVVEFLAEHASGDGQSQNAVERALKDDDHTRNPVRAALKLAVGRGEVTVTTGPKRAKLHRIANPCNVCGMPATSGRDRHESCAPRGGE